MRTILRDLRSTWLGLVFALAGCSVSLEPRIQADPDAPPPIDSQACTTIESCGAGCQRCEAPDDRSNPACDGTSCGSVCKNGLACTDSSCSRTEWTFDSLTLEGLTPRLPSDLSMTIRNRQGNPALAIDTRFDNTAQTLVSFLLPICLSGVLDASAKTLSFRVFYEPPTSGEFEVGDFVQAWLPNAMNGAGISQLKLQGESWSIFSAPLSRSSFSGATTTISIEAWSTNTTTIPVAKTLWFDDFKIE